MPPKQEVDDSKILDERQAWIERAVRNTFRVSEKDTKKLLETEDYRKITSTFFENAEAKQIFIFINSTGSFQISISMPSQYSKKVICFFKKTKVSITPENIGTALIHFEVLESPLETLSLISNKLFLPILKNSVEQTSASDQEDEDKVSRDVVTYFQKFIASTYVTSGQVEGKTLLPIPPDDVIQETSSENSDQDKDMIHTLETAVVNWANQIKEVLNKDPESLFVPNYNPGPLDEMNFWNSKYLDLESVAKQLAGEKVTKVIEILKENQSTYIPSFLKMVEEVEIRKHEAFENHRFLKPLRKYFESVNLKSDNHAEYSELPNVFRSIFHLIFMIWKTSTTYNKSERLVVLVRELCNDLIDHSREYIGGREIFNMEFPDAVEKFENTLSTCGLVKKYYFAYKLKVEQECPTNQWRVPPASLFHRLDHFLERCRDILNIFNQGRLFGKLATLQIGGTKGDSLSREVKDIYVHFSEEIAKFKEIQYDALVVEEQKFEEDFYHFKNQIKEFEKKIGSIISKSFEDCSTIHAGVKVIESFEGLLDREAVQQEIVKKQGDLLQTYRKELKRVQQTFTESKTSPIIFHNMPPVTGAIQWAESLLERINGPMNRLISLSKTIFDNSEGKETVKLHSNIVGKIKQYQQQKYAEWAKSVGEISETKLNEMLLKRTDDGMVIVNFDPALVKLLREVNYLQKINTLHEGEPAWSIPQEAIDLFSKNEKYRTQTGSLEYIVNMYNIVQGSLTPVERPLFQTQIQKIDGILERALNSLSWKNDVEIDSFLSEAMNSVKLASTTLSIIKKNTGEIEKALMKWEKNPMFQRKETRTLTMKELDGRNKEMKVTYEKMVKKTEQLPEELGCIGVDESAEPWKNFVKHINDIVVDGICKSVIASVRALMDQMNVEYLLKTEQSPFLEISLNLVKKPNSEVHFATFTPSLDEKGENSFVHVVDSWINDFTTVSASIPRLDSSSGDYIKEVKSNTDVISTISQIHESIKTVTVECNKFAEQFIAQKAIYETDQKEFFDEFLEVNFPHGSHGKSHHVELPKFDEQIKKYHNIHEQIKELTACDNAGWLRVDAKPIKQELLKICTSWEKLFSNFLVQNVSERLNDIYQFMNTVESGIDKEVTDGDITTLREVIRYIRDIKSETESENGIFQPLQEIVVLLSQYGIELAPNLVHTLEQAPVKWDGLYKRSLVRRTELSDLQDKESQKVKEQGLQFGKRVLKFQEEFRDMAAFFYKSGSQDAYKSIDKWQVLLVDMEKEATKLRELQDLFEITVSEYNALKTCREEVMLLKSLWDIISHILSLFKDWMKTSFKKVDVDALVEESKKLKKTIQNFNTKARAWDSYSGLNNAVNNMLTSLPLVQDLRNPAMRRRHWDELLEETHKKGAIDPDDNFNLDQLLDLGLHSYVDTVQTIVDKASKELIIEKALTKVESVWSTLNFDFGYDGELKCSIMGAVEDIVEILQDNQVQLQNMSTMKYVEFFIESLTKWQIALSTIDSIITEWVGVQKKWQNLYPIFMMSKDIKEKLHEDAVRFAEADTEWRNFMEVAKAVPKIVEACTEPTIRTKLDTSKDVLEILQHIEEKLELCQKSLSEYLETKCKAFPRFYFIKAGDVIDILSKGSFPKLVMKHMSKIVEAVETLTFDENSDLTNGMISKEDEIITFPDKYECKGPVEDWLNGVLNTIVSSLTHTLGDAHAAYVEQQRDQWVFQFPAQIVIVASRVWFTSEVNSAFERQEEGNKNALKDYYNQLKDQLAKLTTLVQGELTPGDRKKIITLITVDVHNRDIVLKLIEEKAESSQVFTWQSQLRYSWDDTKGCTINIADAEFKYGYEYIGNCGCLVITPLTDRCYITLTQSLRLIMGGAPAGPAGTGKTETTKDLGRALGIQVYVFNCTEQMNPASLGNIFKGLSMTGTWGCFDEFNRIRVGVLSVVATQFKSILDAIKAQKKEFLFEQETISLIPTCGVFITMNPGYKGRTELPENLKALFRPCAMIVPDFMNICEIMLASEGFINAKELAKKFVTLYRLNKELLSKQDHYDWGLRAVKSVLVIAGGLKRAEPQVSEDRILMRALRDTNLAKLSRDDIEIFRGLIRDLFPKIEIEAKSDPELVKAVKQATEEKRLQTGENDIFIGKVVQFKELLDVRHSVFVLGPAGSGKSCVWKTLSKAFEIQGRRTWAHVLNPKSVTSGELYGYTHPVSKDWKDGLLSNTMREMYETKTPLPKWIVLDGDIDAEWIESMNTVMDDNKVLTLANNERIPLSPSMRMLFEIDHLRNATPATVSRAGILFLNETDIGWNPFKESWIETRSVEKEKQNLDRLFYTYAPHILFWLKKHNHIIPRQDISMIQTLCYLLEGLITPESCPPGCSHEIYEYYFAFACIWAFGGALEDDERVLFNAMFKKDFPQVKFPENATVFDYFVVTEGETVRLEPWATKVKEYNHDFELPFNEIVVSTADTARLTYLMDLLADRRRPVLLVGTAGTGKTTIVKGKLRSLDEETLYTTINFNSNTDAESFQNILEQSITKKAGKMYGPPGRKKLIYFIDDLNMPNPDKYGTQSAVEFLRQHMDYGFWYDRNNMGVKEVTNVQYLAAMNPKAGSFTVTGRLQRHFGMFACTFPADADLKTIYSQIISAHVESFDRRVQTISTKLVDATIKLHKEVAKFFLPTAVKFHYQFNLREISNIFQGLCRSTKEHYSDPVHMIRLWMHEAFRVFSDRMTEQDDVNKFSAMATKISKDVLDCEIQDGQSLLFSSFVVESDNGTGVYCEANDFNKLKLVLEKKLEEYNSSRSIMNLELFKQAIWHVCRISRILSNPRGNALLVGVGGSGKQSLAKLASFINNYEISQITVTPSYKIIDFKKDLLELYKKSGEKDMKISFILTDSQIFDQKQLVFINDFLSSGFIPELFTPDDVEKSIQAVQPAVKYAGKDHNDKKVCWDFFLEKVKKNLHLVLCFSPVGEQLRVWCRKFPAIMNCSVIDWFHEWPRDALISVAYRFLTDADMNLGDDEMIKNISEHMAFAHESVSMACKSYQHIERRYNYTTPKSFLELIEVYKTLLAKKREELNGTIERLSNGLTKINESEEKVKELSTVLAQEAIIVEEKKRATEELLAKVTKENTFLASQQKIVEEEEVKQNKVVDEVNALAKVCTDELKQAEPLIEKAKKSLEVLNVKDFQELKSFTNPPAFVDVVLSAVMILKAQRGVPKNVVWAESKKMMNNPNQFMVELVSYNAESIPKIPQENIDALKNSKYLQHPNFVPSFIESKSTAAAGLCDWVINVVAFYDLDKQIEPKRQKLSQAMEEKEKNESHLKKISDKLNTLRKAKEQAETEHNNAAQELVRIEKQRKKTEDKLNLAHRLVNGLSDEKIRWAESIKDLREREKTLVGDVLLAAAFLSYVGPFTKKYRNMLIEEKWIIDLKERKIPTSEGIDPLFGVLAEEAQVAQWNNEGLPSDRVSVENGSIVTNCKRWPLLIDPQLQGVKWIKNMESKNNLQVIQLTKKGYLETLIHAIMNGYPVLIENIGENIDPILDPLLAQSYTRKGNSVSIKLGNREVDFDPKFRLYLQTKLPNPHYRPEIVAQTTLLNFMVTEQGLDDQLLGTVVNKERPDLEELRLSYLRQLRQFKIELKGCEDALRNELSNAKGDYLENHRLIDNLEATKKKSQQINVSLKEILENNKMIDESRSVYRTVSTRGSMLYFLIDQLSKIDHMYQYSLEAFMVVFNKALEKAEPADNVDKRVENIVDSITETLFSYVSRGLFERHKLIFSMMLCIEIMRKKGEIEPNQIDFLLRAPRVDGVERKETVIGWCSELSWAYVQALTAIEGTSPAFSLLPDDMAGSWRRWKEWTEFEKPEEKPLPLEWKNLLPFQKLLIIRCLRPDRLTMAVTNFVKERIGEKYVKDIPVDLEVSYGDAGPTTPLFFILSPGVDPVKAVERIGEKFGFTESAGKFKNVSLGEGQTVVAENALQHAFRTGGWVMLNNLHLTPEWLGALEKKLDQYAEQYGRQEMREKKRREKEGLKRSSSAAASRRLEEEEQVEGEKGEEPEVGISIDPTSPQEDKKAEIPEVEEDSEESDEEEDLGHPDFRVFLSAEPSNQIPIGILQRSIKLTNEPPSGLRANLFRSLMQFDDNIWEGSSKQTEFKGILFSLCFFHACIVERKKFGPQGWNRNYPFNLGDLITCIHVLNNYLEDRPKVPWEDLRYVFGEIMYGGHITDDWDRKLCKTYLEKFIRPDVVDQLELCPEFLSPPTNLTYKGYLEYVEKVLPPESPVAFGLHPNAEIGFRTTQGENMFNMIAEMQPRSTSAGDGMSYQDKVQAGIRRILDTLPEPFNLEEIADRLDEERTPYQNSFYQECEYMNRLLVELDRSLKELQSGLDGLLTITEKMTILQDCIYQNKVPETWSSLAYPSPRKLDSWFDDLMQRYAQLLNWTGDLQTPKVVWISGLFNPQSFLTAIMQTIARQKTWALDEMTLVAEVTKKYAVDEIEQSAREGAYVTGMFLEGAGWDPKKNHLIDSKLKDLHPRMPIIHIKAVQNEKSDPNSFYDCPVYRTPDRGPDYIFTCKLKTRDHPSKWIMGGVAMILDQVDTL
ncbi:hypothetical protein NAEGRDRAFT_55628 [Naegleria gruberi]|uniref:AAA+ ATPase domain-containing protein n=1 Tax=Naegleria gruberi TaxID=5762 RepID=D2V307_NAEGR|nr:uncharacterized protein NAEGRDRAFT_55628 [Naegleria gruberi]EFC48546.1 hypothetical protein NAEGRDRAFT_55628 [Naegleria gruberi]|eukprot:XP_002681290.1 hypothetical protein NAEGRDRAFT_55628 [Naegleria gruberi strain NEG-M]